MAISSSLVASWIDRGRANLRVGYTDVTLNGSPTAGVWSLDADNFSPGITLLKVSSEIYDGYMLQYILADETIHATSAAATDVTDQLDGVVIRFYWEGY